MSTLKDVVKYLRFLDSLRVTGLVSMWGCAPHLEESFDLDKAGGEQDRTEWMRTFSWESVEARAAKAELDRSQ
jgi:hypothetical protein